MSTGFVGVRDRHTSLLTCLPPLESTTGGLLPDALYALDVLVLTALAWTHGVAGLPNFMAVDAL